MSKTGGSTASPAPFSMSRLKRPALTFCRRRARRLRLFLSRRVQLQKIPACLPPARTPSPPKAPPPRPPSDAAGVSPLRGPSLRPAGLFCLRQKILRRRLRRLFAAGAACIRGGRAAPPGGAHPPAHCTSPAGLQEAALRHFPNHLRHFSPSPCAFLPSRPIHLKSIRPKMLAFCAFSPAVVPNFGGKLPHKIQLVAQT